MPSSAHSSTIFRNSSNAHDALACGASRRAGRTRTWRCRCWCSRSARSRAGSARGRGRSRAAAGGSASPGCAASISAARRARGLDRWGMRHRATADGSTRSRASGSRRARPSARSRPARWILRDVGHAPRHVLEAGLVRLVVRDRHDLGACCRSSCLIRSARSPIVISLPLPMLKTWPTARGSSIKATIARTTSPT